MTSAITQQIMNRLSLFAQTPEWKNLHILLVKSGIPEMDTALANALAPYNIYLDEYAANDMEILARRLMLALARYEERTHHLIIIIYPTWHQNGRKRELVYRLRSNVPGSETHDFEGCVITADLVPTGAAEQAVNRLLFLLEREWRDYTSRRAIAA